MKTPEIFDLATQIGIDNDPRGRKRVGEELEKHERDYKELPEKKKKEYDLEKLTNPYADSGMHFVDSREINRILAGIDIEPAEILLANQLAEQGRRIDLVIGHHPMGKALATLSEVMEMQADIWADQGIPENIAEGILQDRMAQVTRRVAPENHSRPVDAAKLLNIPLINIHTPADNCVWKYLDNYIKEKAPRTVGDIVESLKEIPEYFEATKLNAGPVVFAGNERSRSGKIVIDMTGGTSASEKIYEKLSQFGIGTIVTMHMAEQSREEAVKHFINVVIAGHYASDSLGMNLILDGIEKRGIEIIPCSGLIRHSRT